MGLSGSDPLKGRRIDRYELHELIGEGGMGAVYRAIDSRLGRTVALKTVVSHRSGEGLTNELRQRFMREALAASKVDHRNVVQVIDFGVTDDGTPYLVMEYLRGRDLGVVLRSAREPLAIAYVADIVLCVCAALRACHQQGVVHRDLKPSNIFLADTDTGPEIKVLDFGVSKAPVAGELTQEGQILGTPQYLSPEQVNGKVGPESDQYALGVLLYVCLTKKLPFEEHQNLSLLRAIEVGRFSGPRAHRPEIPAALEAIVLRAMSADPRARFPSVHALGQALWSFASPRGQVEWKNYYFPAPPTDDTGGGAPARPAAAAPPVERTAVLPPLDRTARLAPPDDAVPERRPTESPQLLISTKLASPPVDPPWPPAPRTAAKRRGWMVGAAAILVVAGAIIARRELAATSATHTPPVPAPDTVSKLATPAPPPVATTPPPVATTPPLPEPIPAVKPAPAAVAGATAPADRLAPSRSHKHPPAHRNHAPAGDPTPMPIGLDKNGIGIPAN